MDDATQQLLQSIIRRQKEIDRDLEKLSQSEEIDTSIESIQTAEREVLSELIKLESFEPK